MSRLIAPGQWTAAKRVAAKNWSKIVGVGLMGAGIVIGVNLAEKFLLSGVEPNMWLVAIVILPSAVPFGFGAAVTFPQVTPLIYRLLDEIDGRKQGPPEGEA